MHEANNSFESNSPAAIAWDRGKASRLARMLFLSLSCLIAISILSLINLYWLRQAGIWRNHTLFVFVFFFTVESSAALATAWYQMIEFTDDIGGL